MIYLLNMLLEGFCFRKVFMAILANVPHVFLYIFVFVSASKNYTTNDV